MIILSAAESKNPPHFARSATIFRWVSDPKWELKGVFTECTMTDSERNELAKAWIALQMTKQHSPEYNSLFWSFKRERNLTREEPAEAWKLILTIWSLDKSTKTMENLSAGPIEDLLSYHGDVIIAHVEQEAKADPSFANLLGGVWQHNMSNEVWNRLKVVWDRRGWSP